ncbi:MAG: diphthamide synthesis protein [Nanoarchaeota archaeon]|nr:diphthamide synthesis protein [Nanoarchaeota archaeon]
MELNLELDRAASEIKKANAKKVCIQLPDGLKPRALEIEAELKKKTDAEIFIWAGSCFGACDVPTQVDKLGIDLLIQWGHSEWQ